MDEPHRTIARSHLDPLPPGLYERFKDSTHRHMEKLVDECAMLALRDTVRADFVAG